METIVHIVNFLNQATDFITALIASVPAEVWTTILGGALASVSGQLYKFWKKIEDSGKMVWVITVISALYSFFVYYASSNPQSPWVIAAQTAGVYLTSQPFYFKGVKRIFNWWKADHELAAARLSEIKSAAVPAGGLDAYKDMPVKTSTDAPTPMGAAPVDNFQE